MTFLYIFIFVYLLALLLILLFFREEIMAIKDRDPAASSILEVLLLYPGLHAIVAHRLAKVLWAMKLPFFPRWVSQTARFLTGIEIHPGATIGKGFFIDHGMGVVIGETSTIGNNVTIYQGVTLGGTGKETGKRHPTIGDNVVIGTGAKVLGNISIGNNSYVGANAVVLHTIPANSTVVGVPGHVTKQDGEKIDKKLAHAQILDPVMQDIDDILRRLEDLEKRGR
ncbi:MAG: serine O-acetyltransferase [Candidatus Omnitrophica bacterium]|nr:serine O-acetyltransferase [Candidatus Omnitrophota bacterium]